MESVIRRLTFMFLNVLLNLLGGDSANRGAEIAARPQVLTPIALAQMGELLLQFAGRYACDVLDNLGRSQQRRAGYQDVDVINADMTLDNRDVSAHTYLADNIACSLGHFGPQHGIAIFGGPHKVVLDVIDCVSTFAVVRHDYPPRFCSEDNLNALKLFA